MDDDGLPLFDRAQLDAVLQPIETARGLPGGLYTEPRVFALERDEIFAAAWIGVGREEDLTEAGRFLRVEVAGRPVLLVAGDDRRPRAFLNTCRHRGSRVVEETSGVAGSFRCPYHGWTYGRDGRLLAAPLMEEHADFDPAAHGLSPVRLEHWGGFLFVNLSDSAAGLAATMSDFPDLRRYGLADLRRGGTVSYEVAANWKIVCENYSECYHCALAHPQLSRISDFRSGGRGFAGRSHNGGPMRLGEGYTTLSGSGRRRTPSIAGIDASDRQQVQYLHFYPTFLIGLAPDYVVVHRVEPLDPQRSRVICDWLFPSEAVGRRDFDPADVVEFWDLTNRQDWELCRRVQEGAAARTRPGPYHPLEFCVHAFDRWLVERIGDPVAELRR
jgi:Rieske 2Fe-2S family protein